MTDFVEDPLPLDEAVRKLATIQVIDNILEHGNADRLEIASVLGWKVVVVKDQFKPGDKVIFFEIGSILPSDVHWSQDIARERFTVKTKKIRGFISQGLVLDVGWVLEGIRSNGEIAVNVVNSPENALNCTGTDKPAHEIRNYYATNDLPPIETLPVGYDLTTVLAVTKQNMDSKTDDDQMIPFPQNIPKTDEPRLQSNMKLLEALHGLPYYISVKIDGCSATYFVPNPSNNANLEIVQNQGLVACSRNNIRRRPDDALPTPDSGISDDIFFQIAANYELEKKLLDYPGYAIQGEIYGPKIQGNRLAVKTPSYAIFNVYNMNIQKYLDYSDFIDFCKKLNLPTVPIIEEGQKFDYTLDQLIEKSRRKYPNSKSPIEGIVIRSMSEDICYKQRRLSFKVINNEFLLKYES